MEDSAAVLMAALRREAVDRAAGASMEAGPEGASAAMEAAAPAGASEATAEAVRAEAAVITDRPRPYFPVMIRSMS